MRYLKLVSFNLAYHDVAVQQVSHSTTVTSQRVEEEEEEEEEEEDM